MTNYELVIKSIDPEGKSLINKEDMKNFCFDYTINDSIIEVYVNIFEEFEYYRLALYLPYIIPENKRIEIAQYLFDQNEFLSYRTFLFSFETGRIVLKSDVKIQNIDLEEFSNYFATNRSVCIVLLNDVYPAIMQLIYNLLSPKFFNKRFIGKQNEIYN
jgi:hypothetical protein